MRRVASTILILLASTVGLLPAPAKAAPDEIRVIVDGKQVSFDVAPYEEWSAGGRLMVQVRPLAMALGCSTISYNPTYGEVEVNRSCINGQRTTLRMWPRDESRTVQVASLFGSSERYELDTPVRFVEGNTMAPARLMADAFNCFSWWTEGDRTFHMDCSHVAQAHQDVPAIMRNHPAYLTAEGHYDYTGYPNGAPMYPSSLPVARKLLGPVNQALAALRESPNLVTVDVDYARDRTTLRNPYDWDEVIAVVNSNWSYAVMDEEEHLRFVRRLKEAQKDQATIGSTAGALFGAVFPEAKAWSVITAVGGGLSAFEFIHMVTDSDIDRLDKCMTLADIDRRRHHMPDDDLLRVTVGMKHTGQLSCIPYAYSVQSWETFDELGVE